MPWMLFGLHVLAMHAKAWHIAGAGLLLLYCIVLCPLLQRLWLSRCVKLCADPAANGS